MTSDYAVAIPSRARANTLVGCTLPTLIAGGVRPQDITVWVTEDEVEAYEAVVGEAFPRVTVQSHGGAPGMGNARNAIVRQYVPGTRLVQVDDDIRSIDARLDSKTLIAVEDIDGLFRRAFAAAAQQGVSLWGIYPVRNPYFMKPRLFVGLTYVIGCLFGMTVTGDPEEQVITDDKEDYERSLRHFIRDGAVARLENVTVTSRFYTEPGGMQTYRTPETIEAGARTLVARWPDLCTYTVNKARGTAEVRLKRMRGVSAPAVTVG